MSLLQVPVAARSAAARLLRLWVPIPPGTWMSVYCECCVLSGRGLCEGSITRPEEFYRLWFVVCDLETSWKRGPGPLEAVTPKTNNDSVNVNQAKNVTRVEVTFTVF